MMIRILTIGRVNLLRVPICHSSGCAFLQIWNIGTTDGVVQQNEVMRLRVSLLVVLDIVDAQC